jgi:hypothetical protein
MNATDYLEEIESNLDHLNTLRKQANFARDVRKAIVKAMEETPEYAAATNIIKDTDALIETTEETIRKMSLVAREEINELPERVEAKEFTEVPEYDEKKAREWCFTNLRKALKFDSKVFEKEVKEKNSDVPAELATAKKVWKIQIATNLEKV